MKRYNTREEVIEKYNLDKDLSNSNLSGLDLSNLNLSCINLSDTNLIKIAVLRDKKEYDFQVQSIIQDT
ncbi:MAG: hypothetical protein RL736_580, partial [Pseudomonadota bacterium]